MKKILVPMFFLLMPFGVFAYTWMSFGPSWADANNICFNVDNQGHSVICASDGMYINDGSCGSWTYYTYSGLPVWDATYFDGQNILLVQGNGSYSDGIYLFNMTTFQFEVQDYVVNPRFLVYNQVNQKYYAGHQYGLKSSTNGTNWSQEAFFDNTQCTSMIYLNNNIIISLSNYLFNIAWSDDGGTTWNFSNGAPPITSMAFNNTGTLYGIFPDHSNSSGLWKSVDFGNNWSVITWLEGLSCVGVDVTNMVFVGWESPFGGYEGVASYDLLSQSLTFYNNGLQTTNINRFTINPSMSAIAVFCCTDGGVYALYDYITGTSEPDIAADIQVFPNPTSGSATIQLKDPLLLKSLKKYRLYNAAGQVLIDWDIQTVSFNKQEMTLDLTSLKEGVYYLKLDMGNKTVVRKIARI